MKHLILPCLVLGAASALAAPSDFKTDAERQSYALGMNMGLGMKQADVEVDPAQLAKGLGDALKGKPLLTEDEARTALKEFDEVARARMTAKRKADGDKNVAEGKKFLDENKAKDGVKTTASGLQYKVITEGSGAKPTPSDTVTVNYKGTLINGEEFDSSYKRGEPATFPLNGVIPGWTEGLQLMTKGSKYQFVIPADLAYGEQGAPGGKIGPNSTLIFEVDLMNIEKTPAAPAFDPGALLEPPTEKPADKKK
jgi:FKBP-type peptidyl-prolyl cis-trans isomerase